MRLGLNMYNMYVNNIKSVKSSTAVCYRTSVPQQVFICEGKETINKKVRMFLNKDFSQIKYTHNIIRPRVVELHHKT